MPRVSVSRFSLNMDRGFVRVKDISDRVHIEGYTDHRLVAQLVVGYGVASRRRLHGIVHEAAADFVRSCNVMTSEEKETKIAELRERSDASAAVSYSRQCNICYTSNPETRVVLTNCGHFLCMACVLTIEKKGRLDCPFCRKSSAYVKVHEDISEETKEEVEEEKEINVPEEEEEEKEEENQVEEYLPTAFLSHRSSIASRRPLPSHFTHRFHTTRRPIRRRVTPQTTQPESSTSPNSIPTLHTVLVGNLPADTTEAELRALLIREGTVASIALNVYRFTGTRYALCHFDDEQLARNVCSLFNRIDYKGCLLYVRMIDD